MPLPTDSALRKQYPLCEGLGDYFPHALLAFANDWAIAGHMQCITTTPWVHLLQRDDPFDAIALLRCSLIELQLELGAPVGTSGDIWADLLEALAETSRVSWFGNAKHNPGLPMGWTRGLSEDHADCWMRHWLGRGKLDGEMRESAAMCWRAFAIVQDLAGAGRPRPRGQRTLEEWKALKVAQAPREEG